MILQTLYKLDSVGRLRTWAMELEGGQYRTLSGLANGKQAISAWTTAIPKSKDTPEAQALFEVEAQYAHQLAREYHETADTVNQPKMIEPMLAKTYSGWPGKGYSQPKLDGMRCLMTAKGMFTREGQPITAVPHLFQEASKLFAENPDLILDGELYNHMLREDFPKLMSICRKVTPNAEELKKALVVQYHVYDLVDRTKKFEARWNLYSSLLEKLSSDFIIPVVSVYCDSRELADGHYGSVISYGYEGGIYRLDEVYELGRRSKFLLKRKEFLTEEFPVVKIEEGRGNWAGAAKRFTLRNRGGSEFGAGTRGSYATLKKLLEEGQPGPAAEATLRFFERTPDGVPRFPVVIDYHPSGRKD